MTNIKDTNVDAKPTIKCPECRGKGGEMMMTTTDGHREIHFEKCGICHGEKKVNKALLEAYRAFLRLADTKPRLSQLRPFFGYYGGKWRDTIKHYPAPKFDTIVEPFAGSAGYSLRYASKKIILCEIDPVLSGVWTYLTQVKPREILAIPDLQPGETVDDLHLCPEAQWLVGLWLNRGTASPRKSPSKWMRDGIRPGSFWGERVRQTIASQVESIRHWKVLNCSYEQCPVQPKGATWFIDPPYQTAGKYYRFGSAKIDFMALATWCHARPGQVIACENEGANWLPFKRLADVKTTHGNYRSKEVIWQSDNPIHQPTAEHSML